MSHEGYESFTVLDDGQEDLHESETENLNIDEDILEPISLGIENVILI